MNREIKFRAWDKKEKIFHYFDISHCINGAISLKNVNIDDLIFSQFTGLKDKNGVQIYDGDIIFYEEDGAKGVISFDSDGGYYKTNNWEIAFSGFNMALCKVIGNIHQNPELLK